MMKWTTKFSTVLGCALAAVFLFTSTMEVGAVPLTSSPSGTTTTTTTDTNAAEDGNADAAVEDNAAEDNAAGTAAAGTVTSATVTSSSVNIRSEASTSASLAGKATSGQELTVTGETQGSDGKTWYAVTFDNVSGYIRSDLVEAHVSEVTAEPAVDETQETEEPEEPIVDNSADYSVAFEDDGSGSSAWYLHDNTMGTRYQVSDLLNAEETNKNNQATIDQTAKSMRFVVILMAFVIVVLIIVVTILIIKVRSTYEDYDDYDDDDEDDEDDDEDEDEEEERPRRFGRKKPARYVEEDEDDEDEDEEEEEERPRRRPAKKAPVKKPVRRPRVDEYEDEDDEDEEEEEERPRRKKGKSKDWQSKNFLDDDDLEFEFLDLK